MIKEHKFNAGSGWTALFILIAGLAGAIVLIIMGPLWAKIVSGVGILVDVFLHNPYLEAHLP